MRVLSTAARASALAESTDEAWLVLLTITAGSTVIRVTSDAVVTSSRSQDFQPFPFTLELPDEWGADEGAPPSVTLAIDAIDGQVVRAVREIAAGTLPTVLVEVVLSGSPGTVEASFEFRVTGVDYDAGTVRATLAFEPVLTQTIPGDAFDPSLFPGLFR